MEDLHGPPGFWPWGLVVCLAACSGEPTAEREAAIDFSGPTAVPAYALRGRWEQERLTYRVDPSGAPAGTDLVAAVAAAAEAWEAAGALELVPHPDPAGAAPHVVLSFARTAHGACRPFGIDGSVAHTGPVPTGSEAGAAQTFVHFDADRDWLGTHSLELAALHELGHVLGLDHVEVESSLMALDPRPDATIGPAERAGLATLYGGELAPDASDVWLAPGADGSDEQSSVLLWRAAPSNTDFALFDADGNGRDEVAVWRTDPRGHGILVLYHFDEQLRPLRTVGPLFGSVIPGAQVSLGRLPTGERVLRCETTEGQVLVRVFDDSGRLAADGPADAQIERTAARVGDLNGDGEVERVFRR